MAHLKKLLTMSDCFLQKFFLPRMSAVDAVDDVYGEGLVPVAGAPVGTLHLAVAGEEVATHAQRKL